MGTQPRDAGEGIYTLRSLTAAYPRTEVGTNGCLTLSQSGAEDPIKFDEEIRPRELTFPSIGTYPIVQELFTLHNSAVEANATSRITARHDA